ncbi:MAG TPA: glycoside hydrolase family 9 protein [Bacteroidales bacterium]|nr:glycoside hydrolase family 9 protein [Bacteroidales bacterium]
MKKSIFFVSAAVSFFILASAGLFLSCDDMSPSSAEEFILNDKDYFEARGFNVMVFENQYNPTFFDEKIAGVFMIHHGLRTATGGAVRINPTPEQWDAIPTMVERNVNRENNSIDVVLSYDDYDFTSKLVVKPQGNAIILSVELDEPLPEILEGRAGLNLEFLPTEYFEKSFIADDKTGLFPLYPSSSMEVKPNSEKFPQFAGHTTFDDRGRDEFVEALPIAQGKTFILAPEDPERRVKIESSDNDIMLLDGRNVAQNGWFVVRTIIPSGKTGKVVEWLITPNLIPGWIRPPVIAHSQVGYFPDEDKVAVIELDKNDKVMSRATLLKLNDNGKWAEAYSAPPLEWGEYLRYNYAKFDFSEVRDPGLYMIQYGDVESDVFQIGTHIYSDAWHKTLDVFFPAQMDHMFVNEAYRVWHGRPYLDDARQAPVNHQHFDGYRMGESTGTKYKPGEHIPGLDMGGWFDAGDFDIQTGRHSAVVPSLINTWETFDVERDETLIDQKQRFVDIHHPDGTPDLLQQIEHGTLALIAQYRAFGRATRGIIVPNLHQYHHLGDAINETDNLIYDPSLRPYEIRGNYSGTPDDRWVFTNESPRENYGMYTALAAAGRVLKGYNDALASECLAAAKKGWVDQHNKQETQPQGRGFMFGGSAEMATALELFISTGEKQYADKFEELFWPSMEEGYNMNMSVALHAIPYMNEEFKSKLIPFVEKYKEANDELTNANPFGVSIGAGGWGGNNRIVSWAITNYQLHKEFPEIIGPEYYLRGLHYIHGCHPGSNISFVSGVGTRSKKYAYGTNRADFSFIAGGVVPGIVILKPDFPEHQEDWPFFWGENEYVIDISADYIYLINAANDLSQTGN